MNSVHHFPLPQKYLVSYSNAAFISQKATLEAMVFFPYIVAAFLNIRTPDLKKTKNATVVSLNLGGNVENSLLQII